MSTPSGDEPPQWRPPADQPGWPSQWQQPQGQAPQTPHWPGYQPAPRTPGKAIASLILGIVSVLLCPIVIPAAIGLFLGYGAKREIDAAGGRLGGRGVALAGIITSWIGLLFSLGLVLLVAAVLLAR